MSDAARVVRYVVGFALDEVGRVALIKKNRPEWQAGKLNGIGGHVEEGEHPLDAMRREFREETGADLDGWDLFVVMEFPSAEIYFYRLRTSKYVLNALETTTDEFVGQYGQELLVPDSAIIPNLRWLIPLAAYTADRYEPIRVRAEMAEALS